ncbi:MAG: hypothetical protein ABSG64_00100 [Solirubrobacteraceae bacterium]|jgi:hypothetical protein
MARITLDLDPAVLAALQRRAERERISIGQIASELLAREFAEPFTGMASEQGPFARFSRDLELPAVELEDADAVWRGG